MSVENAFNWDILSALSDLHAQNFVQARQKCEQVLLQIPRHPHATHLLGLIADHQDQPEESLKLLSRSVQLKPDEPSFHFNQGMAYQKQNLTSEAQAAFEQALSQNPDYLQAHFQLGILLLQANQPLKAQTHFRYILDQSPDFEVREYLKRAGASEAELHYYQGVIALREDREADAESSFYQALQLQPDSTRSQLGLAKLYYYREDFDSAYEWIQRYVKAHPTEDEANFLLALILNGLKKYPESIDALQKSELKEEHILFLKQKKILAENFLLAGLQAEAIAAWQDIATYKWQSPHYIQACLSKLKAIPEAGLFFRQKLSADFQWAEHALTQLEPATQKYTACLKQRDFCLQALSELDNWKSQQPPLENIWGLPHEELSEPFEAVHEALFKEWASLKSEQLELYLPDWQRTPWLKSDTPFAPDQLERFPQLQQNFLQYYPPYAVSDHILDKQILAELSAYYTHTPIRNNFWYQDKAYYAGLDDGSLHPITWDLAQKLKSALPHILQDRRLKNIWIENLMLLSPDTKYPVMAFEAHLLAKIWLTSSDRNEYLNIFNVQTPLFNTSAQSQKLLNDKQALYALQSKASKVYSIDAKKNRMIILQANLLHQYVSRKHQGESAICLNLLFGP